MRQNLLKKYNDMSIVTKASIWFVVSSLIQRGISFLTVPIFTRSLTISEYGIFSLYQSWMLLFEVILTLRLSTGCYYNGLFKYKENKEKFTSSIMGLSLSCVAIGGIIVILINRKINFISGLSNFLVCLAIFQVFIEVPTQFWMTRQRIEYKYVALVIVSIIIAILNPVLGLIFIKLSNKFNAEARILSIVIVSSIFGFMFLYKSIKNEKTFFNKTYWKFALKFNIPLLPHNLSLIILSQSDRIIISNLISVEKGAIYGIAYTLAMLLTIIKESVNQAITPWLYKQIENENYNDIKNITINILIIFAIIIIFFELFAPEIMSIIAPQEYMEAIYVVPPVATSVYFTFLYSLFSSFEFYYEKTTYVMIASIFGAILNIVLNLIFIPMIGFVAAAYTTLFCYLVFCGFHYMFMKLVIKNKYDVREIFNIKVIIWIGIILLLSNVIFSYLYRLILCRYILAFGILIFLLIQRDRIKYLFTTIKAR